MKTINLDESTISDLLFYLKEDQEEAERTVEEMAEKESEDLWVHYNDKAESYKKLINQLSKQ